MTPGVSYEFQLFYRNLKKWLFPQIRFFGNVFPYLDNFLLKTKMVRTVHRNILYSVDWGIRDSKRGFGRKSKNGHFQKWGLKNEIWGLGPQNGSQGPITN